MQLKMAQAGVAPLSDVGTSARSWITSSSNAGKAVGPNVNCSSTWLSLSERLLSAVVNDSMVSDGRKFRQRVRREFAVRHDVHDLPSAHRQVVRDDPPMTPPPQPLGAHDRGAGLARRLCQFDQAGSKFRRFGIVGVRPESRMLPRAVRRIDALGSSSPAQRRTPSIARFAAAAERPVEVRLLVELRPSSRAGKGADVREDRNSMLAEQFEEAFDRMRRVADCVKRCDRMRVDYDRW